jgi:hypothetical protein
VCEQVCRDAVWIPQNVLLAEDTQIENVVKAIRKIAACADVLRAASDTSPNKDAT